MGKLQFISIYNIKVKRPTFLLTALLEKYYGVNKKLTPNVST